jgi:hypothetical protein
MLRRDVIEAVEEKRFRIYPISTIDQGIEILTGTPAGARDEKGEFAAETINQRVEAKLIEFADKRRAYAAASRDADKP